MFIGMYISTVTDAVCNSDYGAFTIGQFANMIQIWMQCIESQINEKHGK